MNEQLDKRVTILEALRDGSISLREAATILQVTIRHVRRLLRRFCQSGGDALVHGLRGRPSNHRLDLRARAELDQVVSESRDKKLSISAIQSLVQQRSAIRVSRETVRRRMQALRGVANGFGPSRQLGKANVEAASSES